MTRIPAHVVAVAADLVIAARNPSPATHATLLPLTLPDLRALAVLLARSVDPERPLVTATDHTIATIVAASAQAHRVTPDDIYGRGRTAQTVAARQVACYLARRYLGESLAAIGAALGRDHTTVLHAVRRVTDNPDLCRRAERLARRLDLTTPREDAA